MEFEVNGCKVTAGRCNHCGDVATEADAAREMRDFERDCNSCGEPIKLVHLWLSTHSKDDKSGDDRWRGRFEHEDYIRLSSTLISAVPQASIYSEYMVHKRCLGKCFPAATQKWDRPTEGKRHE